MINTEIDDSLVRNQEVWIGLFNDAWMWSDGQETSFRYWLSGMSGTQNLGNCASVAVSQHGCWVEAPCNKKSTFVSKGVELLKCKLINEFLVYATNLLDFSSEEIGELSPHSLYDRAP